MHQISARRSVPSFNTPLEPVRSASWTSITRKGGARRRQRRDIALIDTSLKTKMTRGDFSVEEPHVSD
jgi:hypothetical protein